MKKNQRALSAIRTLRQRHNNQARQIEILCRDMVCAHGQFSTKLSKMNFVAAFYESLLAATNEQQVLNITSTTIRTVLPNATAALCILSDSGFDIHQDTNTQNNVVIKPADLNEWFTKEMIRTIGQHNSVYSLDELLHLGLQAPPKTLKNISAVAVPLGTFNQPTGCLFIYGHANSELSAKALGHIASVTPGIRSSLQRFAIKTNLELPTE